jgi:hypothetical protein
MREPRYLHVGIAQQVGDVVRRGLAIDSGAECKHDLFYVRLMRTAYERRNIQIVRSDAVERRERAAEHVITPVYRACTLQRPEIGDILDRDKQRRIARMIRAD